MEKKYFNAPFLKVVRVQNDIIATSNELGIDAQDLNEENLVQGRRSIWDEY